VDVVALALASMVSGKSEHAKFDTKMPFGIERANHCCEAVNGRLYVYAGDNGSTLPISGTCFEYNPETNTWTQKSSSASRTYAASGNANDRLYLIGGNDTSPSGYFPKNTVYEYDPTLNTWTTKATYQGTITQCAAASLNGKIYSCGGITNPTTPTSTNACYEFDPIANSWTAKANVIPVSLVLHSMTTDGQIIYSVGGANTNIKKTYSFDPAVNVWVEKADTTTNRYSFTTAYLDGKIYAFGSYGNNVGLSYEEYDIALNQWTLAGYMQSYRRNLKSAALNGGIYLTGGFTTADTQNQTATTLNTLFTPGKVTFEGLDTLQQWLASQ